jgi:hypothetical protein
MDMAIRVHLADAFDNGYEDEAKRLAVVIRVLLHDTKASKSVLGLLGVKDKLQLMDTATVIDPGNLISTPGLVMFEMGGADVNYVAPLQNLSPGRQNPPKAFESWWKDSVTKDTTGAFFARRDYVLNVANKEGGAHVDPKLQQTWASLTRDNSLGWKKTGAEVPDVPMDSPALASIRQIAYEVNQTLRAQLAHLLSG